MLTSGQCQPSRWSSPVKPQNRVRREKVIVHRGSHTRPGTGSLHPVAIRAVEATRLLRKKAKSAV